MAATSTARTARTARRSAPFVVLGSVVAAGALLTVAHRAGVPLPACPFHALTGLDCPGCGGTRALLALSRGDVVTAADHHLLLVAALPVLLLAWVDRLRSGRRFGATVVGSVLTRPWVVGTVVAVLLGFTVLRNLPGVPWLDAAA